MSFITILEDDAAFPWSPLKDDGEQSETVFQLRIVPDDVNQQLQRKHTKKVLDPKSRSMVEESDWRALSHALLDYAIVDWTGLHGSSSKKDVPCSAEMKTRLPERIKQDVIRLCVAKEGGDVAAAAEEKKPSKPISGGKPTA